MTITNGYCTLADLKARLFTGTPTVDATRDTILEDVIEAASRWIDDQCGRRFYTASETRTYTAQDYDLLFIDDLVSVTTLKTDEDEDRTYETTWATTDYDLEPENAALRGAPYTMIRITPDGDYSFPVGVRRGVQIAGSFGYASTVPDPVKQACLMQAARLYKRKDAILGVAGVGQLGQQTVQRVPSDDEIMELLRPYRRIIP